MTKSISGSLSRFKELKIDPWTWTAELTRLVIATIRTHIRPTSLLDTRTACAKRGPELHKERQMQTGSWLTDGPSTAEATFIFAHGAGAAMDTDFMEVISSSLAKQGIRVIRFEFPYMETRRSTGKKRPPDREPRLIETWRSVIEAVQSNRLAIGGKSMGGRVASLIADEVEVDRLVCLGYPFHPLGKPDQLRVDHLRTLKTPCLILQGERDPMGNREEVLNYSLPEKIKIQWMTDGDHSFKPRKASGWSAEQNWLEAAEHVGRFLLS